MGPILKQFPLSVGSEQLMMSEVSALDYLDYLDYLDANPLPPEPDDKNPAVVRQWLRDTQRADLHQVSRLVALVLYRGLNVSVDAAQELILQGWPLALTQAVYLEAMKFIGLAADNSSAEPPADASASSDDVEAEPLTPKS